MLSPPVVSAALSTTLPVPASEPMVSAVEMVSTVLADCVTALVLPSAVPPLSVSPPAVRLTAPKWLVLVPLSVSVPVPLLVRGLAPLRAPLSVALAVLLMVEADGSVIALLIVVAPVMARVPPFSVMVPALR
ncbi:hypothetical protein D3C84_792110 [compost metagenome]